MGYSHFEKVSGEIGLYVGAHKNEIQVATATGQLYQQNNAITATAAQLNSTSSIATLNSDMTTAKTNISTAQGDITTLENGVFDGSSRWDDYNVPLIIGKPTAGGRPDYDYINCGYLFPQNDKTEILIVRAQMPHRWRTGTTIYPHVHWRQKANQAAVFKIDYKWYSIGDLEPDNWSTYTMDIYTVAYTSGTLSQVSKGASGISGTGKYISSILIIKLYREDNVYTGDTLVDDFDIHYQIDSTGSQAEYIKT